MEKQTLKVQGMSCEHCVRAVSKALEDLPGLNDVKVELKSGTVSFRHDPAKTDLAAIEAAIVEAGYEVAP
jgi:copper ion binding protein